MPRRQRPKKQYYCSECNAEITARRSYRSGLCHDCAAQRMRDNREQLQAKRGPYYEKWLANWQASIRRKLEESENGKSPVES